MKRTRLTTKGIVASLVFLFFVVAVAVYLPLTLLTPVGPTVAQVLPPAATGAQPAALTWPAYGGGAVTAIGYPESLSVNGSPAPQSIASITKIITALVVLDAKPLTVGEAGPTIIFSDADVALIAKYAQQNGKTVKAVAGRTISEHDLISVALIASANNYADSLAIWAFGSQAAFVTATATWLTAHSLTHTTIVEPTGINSKNVSTPTELITIGQLALANPVLAEIVATPTVTIDGVGTITNSNLLLGKDGVDGIKTGTLDSNGSDLLFSADYVVGLTKITVVGAILGAPNHAVLNVAVEALLATVHQGFHSVVLAAVGQKFATYTTEWGSTAHAVATKSTSAVMWSNPVVSRKVTAPRIHGSESGDSVGSVVFTLGGKTITVPLKLDQDLPEPDFAWRITHPAEVLG